MFEKWGVSRWGYTEDDLALSFDQYLSWIEKYPNSPLKYLYDDRKNKRSSLKNMYHDFKSALIFLFPYFLTDCGKDYNISAYPFAFENIDYHVEIKKRLIDIVINELKLNTDEYLVCIDTHPLLERDLAYKTGLGWFGKNSMLMNKDDGSSFFIASILLKNKLDSKYQKVQAIEKDHCGTCKRCIFSCPTNAINEDRTINPEKCLSTITVEVFKNKQFPDISNQDLKTPAFGCDICQRVCPWNNKKLSLESKCGWLYEFFDRVSSDIVCDLEGLSNKQFKMKFKDTAFERMGKKGLLENFYFIQKDMKKIT